MNRTLPAAAGGVTVLVYHLAGAKTSAPVDLPARIFRSQLDELAAGGLVVTLPDALDSLATGEAETEHRIVLTFDDAFCNFFEVAWPLLAERELPAVLYVPVGFLDGSHPAPLEGAEHLPPMSWEQIREVVASGLVTIGSHSVSHPDLRRLSEPDCRVELVRSRQRLEDETGGVVTSFCYPRALWSPGVRALAAEFYDSAVAAGGRRNRSADFDRLGISRLPLRRDMPAALGGVLDKSIWLEEWTASGLRRLRHR